MSFRTEQTIKLASSGGHYMDGMWVPNAKGATKKIQASVQPATQSDYDKLIQASDGARIERAVRFYTDADLKQLGNTANDTSDGDILIYDNQEFVIRDKSKWQSGVISHYRYLAVLI